MRANSLDYYKEEQLYYNQSLINYNNNNFQDECDHNCDHHLKKKFLFYSLK